MEMYTLNNGMQIPAVGFGCYNAKGGDNYQILSDAIKSGYTLFDTASFYETERDLGKAIIDAKIDRKNLFIQSKLWIDEMGYDNAKAAIERTLKRLNMDYLDVYLIHWPRQSTDTSIDEWKKLQLETYKALEEMVDEGLIKAIGLSNFLPHHMNNILSNTNIKPVVCQLEYHLGYTQDIAVGFAKLNDIYVQAWSPLGRGSLITNNVLDIMAKKYGKSVAQVTLRYLIQESIIPIVKSGCRERMIQNMEIFDFEISDEDMSIIKNMPQSTWLGEHPDFNIPKRKSNFNQ